MKQLQHIDDVNREKQVKQFCRVFFIAIAFLGSSLYYFLGNTMLGGFGLSSSLFSLVSFFHFNKTIDRKSEKMDTKRTWFFLGMICLGILVIVANRIQDGPHFHFGIAGAMSLIGGMAYCMELFLTWLDNVR